MPGWTASSSRGIRATPLLSHLPVIMITSADDRREAAEAAGVTVLLGKPYPEETLLAHQGLPQRGAAAV